MSDTDREHAVRHDMFIETRHLDAERADVFRAFGEETVLRRWFRLPGHGDPGRRHPAADRPEPARRRLQRPRHREHPQVRSAGTWLALSVRRQGAVSRSPPDHA